MIKFLGFADILASIVLVALGFNLSLPDNMIIIFAGYLFLKALIFLVDIGSVFDIIGGALLVLSLFIALPPLVFFIGAVLIGLKGVMSLFAF